MTPARARLWRHAPGAVVIVLACLGFFVHGLHEWARVLMFIAIVGAAAWRNGTQTQTRECAPEQAPGVVEPAEPAFPTRTTLAD